MIFRRENRNASQTMRNEREKKIEKNNIEMTHAARGHIDGHCRSQSATVRIRINEPNNQNTNLINRETEKEQEREREKDNDRLNDNRSQPVR